MKDIEGYEGRYAVTEDGQVWSHISHKFLHPKVARNQYREVCLYKDGRKKMFYVHRLVAAAFIPNPDNLSEVNHLDFDKGNNDVSNLEWTTSSGNSKHYCNAKRRLCNA